MRSAESGGFSAAARQLGLTPSAVSRNVALLERNLGVRLFQRSTRKLTLTEAGQHLLASVRTPLRGIQAALSAVGRDDEEPAYQVVCRRGVDLALLRDTNLASCQDARIRRIHHRRIQTEQIRGTVRRECELVWQRMIRSAFGGEHGRRYVASDAHGTSNFDFLSGGVQQARRGSLSIDQILNSRSMRDLVICVACYERRFSREDRHRTEWRLWRLPLTRIVPGRYWDCRVHRSRLSCKDERDVRVAGVPS